jgi:hypothetical protein
MKKHKRAKDRKRRDILSLLEPELGNLYISKVIHSSLLNSETLAKDPDKQYVLEFWKSVTGRPVRFFGSTMWEALEKLASDLARSKETNDADVQTR